MPIKVDREERPDVDHVYMTLVPGDDGLRRLADDRVPDARPEAVLRRHVLPAGDALRAARLPIELLERVAEAWQTDRETHRRVGGEIDRPAARALGHCAGGGRRPSRRPSLDAASTRFRRAFDRTHGGFGGAPKFPRPLELQFLLRYCTRAPANRERARDGRCARCDAMARGGIHDHLGGGFHRYSVDERWLVPHFEKMLYDQAQLAMAYLEAFQVTGERAVRASRAQTSSTTCCAT